MLRENIAPVNSGKRALCSNVAQTFEQKALLPEFVANLFR